MKKTRGKLAKSLYYEAVIAILKRRLSADEPRLFKDVFEASKKELKVLYPNQGSEVTRLLAYDLLLHLVEDGEVKRVNRKYLTNEDHHSKGTAPS